MTHGLLEPGRACLACAGPTVLRHRGRGGGPGPLAPDEVRCTTRHLGAYEDIWACPHCGLAYQATERTPEALADAYRRVVDEGYLRQEPWKREEFRRLLAHVEAFGPPGKRLLEIGSFTGFCLTEASALGWDAVGVEPSAWAAAHARARGAEVIESTVDDLTLDDGSFDVVCAWDTIEHFADPLSALRRIHALLAPDGVVSFTTVNIAGLSARLLGRRWPWLARMHLWYFTDASLRMLMQRAGFATAVVGGQAKRVPAGYILDRVRGWVPAPVADAALAAARRTGLDRRMVTVDLGDHLLVTGRKRR